MADENNVLESNCPNCWEDLNEVEMFEQSQAVSETSRNTAIPKGPMVLQGEDSLRSQYLPPEPSVKILKRPSKEERLNAQGGVLCLNGGGKPVKTLRQREAEYAEARQRIMGHANAPDDELNDRLGKLEPSASPAPTAVYTLLRPPVDSSRLPADVVRAPRGPDGTPGFTMRR